MELFLRDPRFAARNFKMRDSVLTGIPRSKFLYFVNFQTSSGQSKLNSSEDGISFLAKSVERPKIKIQTETNSFDRNPTNNDIYRRILQLRQVLPHRRTTR